MADLNGKRVAFLATDMVEQVELTKPWEAVEQAGGSPELISLEEGEIQAFDHYDKADTFQVDRTVSDASVDDYDALVIPGGVGNPDTMRGDEDAVRFVREFMESGKPTAAICHAPWMLVEADAVSRPQADVLLEHQDGRHECGRELGRRGGRRRRQPRDEPVPGRHSEVQRADARALRARAGRSGSPGVTAKAALLDVDGTLIDTNYQHALAWYRAFRRHGIVLPIWRIHRSIGMGGDQLVPALVGEVIDREQGDEIRETRDELYQELIGEVRPLHGSRELIVDLKERGVRVVLASSSPQEELDHYLDLLDARELADAWTTKDDVEQTKPAPDLVRAAMDKAETDEAVMIGDTRWDIEAAAKAGVETVAVMTGGWSKKELLDAGAVLVFESVDELRQRLDSTPFG